MYDSKWNLIIMCVPVYMYIYTPEHVHVSLDPDSQEEEILANFAWGTRSADSALVVVLSERLPMRTTTTSGLRYVSPHWVYIRYTGAWFQTLSTVLKNCGQPERNVTMKFARLALSSPPESLGTRLRACAVLNHLSHSLTHLEP